MANELDKGNLPKITQFNNVCTPATGTSPGIGIAGINIGIGHSSANFRDDHAIEAEAKAHLQIFVNANADAALRALSLQRLMEMEKRDAAVFLKSQDPMIASIPAIVEAVRHVTSTSGSSTPAARPQKPGSGF